MKRNLIGASSLVVLSLLLTAAGAVAQSSVSASMPFAFDVRGQHMPAGTYSVERQTDTYFFKIQNRKTGSSVMALGTPGLSGDQGHKLVFHHTGGRYFLRQIWGVGANGMAVPASKLEKELQISRVTPPATSNVEIALK